MSRAASAKHASESAQLPAPQLSFLPGYSEACKMIERAARVDEAKAIRDKAEAFRAYAIKAHNRDMEFFATEIRMRAERKAGALLIDYKASNRRQRPGGDRKSKSASTSLIPRLSDLGVTPDESAHWQRMAKLAPDEFERRLAKVRANGKPGSLDVMYSSASDEWLTPREILDYVVSVLGSIDLDPCAERNDESANVPAGAHFTKKVDGLSKVWSGAVFMNPPYSAAAGFVDKLIASWKAAEVTQAIALLPSRTDTGWFRAILAVAPVCFVAGRIMFIRAGEPDSKVGAPFPSAVFYLGPNRDRFAAVFSPHFGPICREGI